MKQALLSTIIFCFILIGSASPSYSQQWALDFEVQYGKRKVHVLSSNDGVHYSTRNPYSTHELRLGVGARWSREFLEFGLGAFLHGHEMKLVGSLQGAYQSGGGSFFTSVSWSESIIERRIRYNAGLRLDAGVRLFSEKKIQWINRAQFGMGFFLADDVAFTRRVTTVNSYYSIMGTGYSATDEEISNQALNDSNYTRVSTLPTFAIESAARYVLPHLTLELGIGYRYNFNWSYKWQGYYDPRSFYLLARVGIPIFQ